MSIIYALLQLLGAATAMLGLWLLAGPAWTALVGGVFLLVVATLAEAAQRRPVRPQSGGE